MVISSGLFLLWRAAWEVSWAANMSPGGTHPARFMPATVRQESDLDTVIRLKAERQAREAEDRKTKAYIEFRAALEQGRIEDERRRQP